MEPTTSSVLECTPLDLFCHMGWFFDELMAMHLYVIDMVLSAFVTLLEILPVPVWLENASTLSGSIPGDAVYFMDLFLLPTGISFVVSAYTLRFLIRRIPVVG